MTLHVKFCKMQDGIFDVIQPIPDSDSKEASAIFFGNMSHMNLAVVGGLRSSSSLIFGDIVQGMRGS